MQAVLDALAENAAVVTANERIARALACAYDQRQRSAGLRVWRTPAIFSWQGWMARLWAASLAVRGAGARYTLLTASQESALWRTMIAGAEVSYLPGDARAVARLAQRTWRVCQNWRITEGDLSAAADSSDTQAFARSAARYRQHCESRGWVDAGMLPALLSGDMQRGCLPLPASVYLVGFVEWTALQREFLRVLATASTVHEAGLSHVAHPQIRRVALRDQRHELECAARWARQRLEANPGAVVAVVVPDLAGRASEVRRDVLDIVAPDWRLVPGEELPANFSFGAPITALGLSQTALLLLLALEPDMDLPDVGLLLRSPHVPGALTEAGARAGLDLWCREGPGRLVHLSALADKAQELAPLFSGVLRRLRTLGDHLPRRQATTGWVATFREALKATGWPGDHGLASDEYQAAMAFDSQLDALGSCDLVTGEIDFREALALFREQLQEELFQPAGRAGGLQVMGLLEAVGQSFDALWVCGLTSDAWPPDARPDPLLPVELQRRLGIPGSSAAAARERAERLLRWLEASALEVVLSWPQFKREEPLTVSPLIEHVAPYNVADLDIWGGPRREDQLLVARCSELLDPDPAPPLDASAMPVRGGAALLERQARCPARAFLEFRLGARELSRPVTGIDPITRGKVLHDVLQGFFHRVTTHEQLCRLDADAQAAIVDALIDAQLNRRLPQHDPLLLAVARTERQRLRWLIEEFLDLERQREPFFVVATEQDLPLGRAPPALRLLGISLRLDRMDEVGDGRRLVIDYKAGHKALSGSAICGPRPRAPQLPLYALCTDADAVAFVQLTAGGTRWVGVGRGTWGIRGVQPPEKLTHERCADWGALRADWWSALDRLAREILQGDFRVDRWRLDEALGQWAMATRAFELPPDAEEPPP